MVLRIRKEDAGFFTRLKHLVVDNKKVLAIGFLIVSLLLGGLGWYLYKVRLNQFNKAGEEMTAPPCSDTNCNRENYEKCETYAEKKGNTYYKVRKCSGSGQTCYCWESSTVCGDCICGYGEGPDNCPADCGAKAAQRCGGPSASVTPTLPKGADHIDVHICDVCHTYSRSDYWECRTSSPQQYKDVEKAKQALKDNCGQADIVGPNGEFLGVLRNTCNEYDKCKGGAAPTRGPTAPTPTSTPTSTPTRTPTPTQPTPTPTPILKKATDQVARCVADPNAPNGVKMIITFKDNSLYICKYRIAKGEWVNGNLVWNYLWNTEVDPADPNSDDRTIQVIDTDVKPLHVYVYSIQPWAIGEVGGEAKCGAVTGDWAQTNREKCPAVGPNAPTGTTTPTPTSGSTPTATPTGTLTPTPTSQPVAGELNIAKTYAGACISGGYRIDYTITLTYPSGNGPEQITYDYVRDRLDSKVKSSWVSNISSGGTLSSGVISWPSGSINKGQEKRFTYRVTVPTLAFGVFTNKAEVKYSTTVKTAELTVSTACAGKAQTGVFDNVLAQLGVAFSLIALGALELKYGIISRRSAMFMALAGADSLKGFLTARKILKTRREFEDKLKE